MLNCHREKTAPEKSSMGKTMCTVGSKSHKGSDNSCTTPTPFPYGWVSLPTHMLRLTAV